MQDPLPIAIETPRRRRPQPQPARRPMPVRRPGSDWRIDARTRHLGLMGVAQARAALAPVAAPAPADGERHLPVYRPPGA